MADVLGAIAHSGSDAIGAIALQLLQQRHGKGGLPLAQNQRSLTVTRMRLGRSLSNHFSDRREKVKVVLHSILLKRERLHCLMRELKARQIKKHLWNFLANIVENISSE